MEYAPQHETIKFLTAVKKRNHANVKDAPENKIVLMYHSVASEDTPGVCGSFPISMDEFKRHIELARERGYQFDAVSNLHAPIDDDEKRIYITGDDGTTDWSRNVLPWCEEQGIPTHTAVITGPFEETPIYPLTHVIQVILTTRSAAELQQLADRVSEDYLHADQIEYIDRIYHYETLAYRRRIKGAFNLVLEPERAFEAIGELTVTERGELEHRFEHLEYYKQFKHAEVGVHTRSHWAVGGDTQRYVDDEIEHCKTFMLEHGLTPTDYFTSPMKPKYGATIEDLIEPLRTLGYKGIFDMAGIWDQSDFIIRRIDAKHVEAFLGA